MQGRVFVIPRFFSSTQHSFINIIVHRRSSGGWRPAFGDPCPRSRQTLDQSARSAGVQVRYAMGPDWVQSSAGYHPPIVLDDICSALWDSNEILPHRHLFILSVHGLYFMRMLAVPRGLVALITRGRATSQLL